MEIYPKTSNSLQFDWKPMILVPVSDTQVGSAACSESRFRRWVQRLLELYDNNNYNLRFIGVGDYVDALRPSIRKKYAASGLNEDEHIDGAIQDIVHKHIEKFLGLVDGTQGKWLTLLEGHHYYCVSGDTEALTKDGWVSWKELEEGQLILAYDPGTNTQKWEPVKSLNSFLFDGSLYECGHHLATKEHRWWGSTGQNNNKEWVFSDDPPSQLTVPVVGGSGVPFCEDESVSNDVVALVAWVFTDGSIIKRKDNHGWTVRVFQSSKANPLYCEEIETLMGDYKWSVYEDGRNIRRYSIANPLSREIRKAFEGSAKRLSLLWLSRLTTDQLQLFWETALKGDGHKNRLYQAKEDNLGKIQALFIERGIPARVRFPSPSSQIYELYIRHHSRTRFTPKLIPYTGVVWCPTIESGYWFARRNGHVIITGNSYGNGVTSDTILADRLNAPFGGDSTRIHLTFNCPTCKDWKKASTQEFQIMAHHGEGGGATPGAPFNKMYPMLGRFEFDSFLMAHQHKAGSVKLPWCYDIKCGNGYKSVDKDRSLVATGGWLAGWQQDSRNEGRPGGYYPEQKMLPPLSIGGTRLYIEPRHESGNDWIFHEVIS